MFRSISMHTKFYIWYNEMKNIHLIYLNNKKTSETYILYMFLEVFLLFKLRIEFHSGCIYWIILNAMVKLANPWSALYIYKIKIGLQIKQLGWINVYTCQGRHRQLDLWPDTDDGRLPVWGLGSGLVPSSSSARESRQCMQRGRSREQPVWSLPSLQ